MLGFFCCNQTLAILAKDYWNLTDFWNFFSFLRRIFAKKESVIILHYKSLWKYKSILPNVNLFEPFSVSLNPDKQLFLMQQEYCKLLIELDAFLPRWASDEDRAEANLSNLLEGVLEHHSEFIWVLVYLCMGHWVHLIKI